MAHVILFKHASFHGAHKHVFGPEPNLNAGNDNFFNDKTSSIVVLEGTRIFFRDSNFEHQDGPPLGHGVYPSVEAVSIKNDDISSLRPS
jgi:Beta/Gamma crystallin